MSPKPADILADWTGPMCVGVGALVGAHLHGFAAQGHHQDRVHAGLHEDEELQDGILEQKQEVVQLGVDMHLQMGLGQSLVWGESGE